MSVCVCVCVCVVFWGGENYTVLLASGPYILLYLIPQFLLLYCQFLLFTEYVN